MNKPHTAISVNLIILVLLIAWNLMDDVIQKMSPVETKIRNETNVLTTNDETDTPATSPIVVKEASCSCYFLLKILIAI
ncbi:MAG: hypothetical protein JXK50_07095 [Campylobacterales bacterium]|nr:hypothetical protein [Campylobacterales bacterium]